MASSIANTTLATKLRYAVYIGASSTVFGSALYLAYHTQRMEQQFKQRTKELLEQQPSNATDVKSFSFVHSPQRNEQYRNVATCYDDAIGRDEFYMGINLLRRLVLYWYAKGTVLEVGAGTGRNIPYYRYPHVQRVVLVDTCYEMLEQARDKVWKRTSRNKANPPQYAFVQGDSAQLDQLPDHAFDTVIDTFGLCSYNDPVAVVREMIRKCKRKEENGILIFIEHGRSKSWNIVTQHLDKHAEQHAANWGCVWNRDLDDIVQQTTVVETDANSTKSDDTTTTTTNMTENSRSDTTNSVLLSSSSSSSSSLSPLSMEIVHLQTFHFGTTYVIVARPAQ